MIRHGESTANQANILQGQVDTELTTDGYSQAKKVHHMLPRAMTLVYSSGLKRAIETAKIVFPDKEIHIDDRLLEMDLGQLEGKWREKLSKEEKKMWKQIELDLHYSGHGGETGAMLTERVKSFFSEIIEFVDRNPESNIGVVTHFGVIQAFLTQVLSEPRMEIPNGGVIKLVRSTNKWNVEIMSSN